MKKIIIDGLYLVLGCAIMAIGTACFLLPNQLSSGGFSGIATIVYYLFQFPMGATIVIFNIPFFIWAFFRLGKELIIKSLLGTVFLATFIDIFDKIPILISDKFLACIYGGVCIGMGMGFVLKAGGSTGGTDLITYIAKSYQPYISTSSLIVIIDIVIILLNIFFFKKVEIGLYSAIVIYLVGKMIDIIFEGVNFTKMILIISNQYKEIAHAVEKQLERGSTGIYAKGMYTKEEKMMLVCVASRGEIAKIKQLATKIDKKAFIVIVNAREAWGEGFKMQ